MYAILSRRALLKSAVGAAVLNSIAHADVFAAAAQGLQILCAPNGASLVLIRLLESGGLSAAAPGATSQVWRSTDELRAGIVSGRTRLFTTPTHVPANLFNRGLPIKLLCILSRGHLSIVTSDDSIQSFADLKGKPVLGFFRNDMPDLVFRAVAKMEGLDPDKDMTLTYVQSPMEAAHTLAAGKATTAILPEPMATGSMMMAKQSGRMLRRAISLEEVWFKHRKTHIPMAGIAVHEKLLEDTPELLPALKDGLPKAKDWIFANRKDAGELAARTLGVRAEAYAMSLDHFNIEVVSARSVKDDLVGFYQTLLELAPDSLGGKLPSDDFYLDL